MAQPIRLGSAVRLDESDKGWRLAKRDGRECMEARRTAQPRLRVELVPQYVVPEQVRTAQVHAGLFSSSWVTRKVPACHGIGSEAQGIASSKFATSFQERRRECTRGREAADWLRLATPALPVKYGKGESS